MDFVNMANERIDNDNIDYDIDKKIRRFKMEADKYMKVPFLPATDAEGEAAEHGQDQRVPDVLLGLSSDKAEMSVLRICCGEGDTAEGKENSRDRSGRDAASGRNQEHQVHRPDSRVLVRCRADPEGERL